MGRDWYWGGKSSKREREGRGRVIVSTDSTTTSTGCMCAVFQLFDFQQLQIPLNHHQQSFKPNISPSGKDTIPEGAEAPRNSLKSEGEGSSLSSIVDEENSLNIPMGIQIKTSRGIKSTDSSETSSSPATKTPTLVARLMGLDLLPETNTPTFNSSNSQANPSPLSKSHSQQRVRNRRKPLQSKPRNFTDNDTGTHSLPETPRISLARRSDVDHHHRLSLQINKESVVSNASEDLDFSRLLSIRRKFDKIEDESRNPSHYARQIVKHVKESVSRKAGLDITNRVRNREVSRDELVYQLKSKKATKFLTKMADESTPGEQSKPSSNKSNKPSPSMLSTNIKDQNVHVQPHQTIKVSAKPKQQLHQEQPQKSQLSTQKCRKIGSALDRFGPSPKKQEETFVRPSTVIRANSSDKKCKKTPLSNNLLNLNVPTLFPLKKTHSPQATKIPHKQPELYDAQKLERSPKYKREMSHVLNTRDSNNGDTSNCTTTFTTIDGGAELKQYISCILGRTGIHKNTPVSFTKWFSPSHPLDPSIFHFVENSNICSIYLYSSQLKNRCYRNLMFYLVDEMLVQILKPYINMKPWVKTFGYDCCTIQMSGLQLIDTLCLRIQSFPSADCKVLEDIDELINKDLPELKLQREMAFEEEAERLVTEIESDILDTLVHETALFFGETF